MPPLSIGVDARELLGDATGVGGYLWELLRRWTGRSDADRRRLVLFAPDPLQLPLPEGATETRITGGGRGTWWEQVHLRRAVRADSPDVFFAPAYTAPLGMDQPLAVTIHDVSFMAHPEWFRAREGLRRRWLTQQAAARAGVILTVSEFSRSEIELHLQVPRDRIRVFPLGVTTRVRAPRPSCAREPLVLFVGSLFNRRRLPDLVAAFAKATRDLPAATLVIAGHDRTWPPEDLRACAMEHGVAARMQLRSYVDGDTLADLYARARVFAFLSEYEGFGLTPLEALAAGVPPVVLDTPVAREVYGDAAAYVEPFDVAGAAAALRRLLTDPASAEAILARAPEVLSRYSWEATADGTLEAIEGIARR
ncbi:MAG TPA: glycosyltransferase family 1 protein [Vicinamibacterales bacterium]|nr:glycosyltransferase family 1 protein [Vicinamibacterales bacterium]